MSLPFWRVAGRPAWMPGTLTLAALGWFALTTILLLVLFRGAAERAVRLWIDTPTYSYAFLIVPISIYLVVQKAGHTALPRVTPWPALLLLHIPIGVIWYVAVAAEIVEVQQFCLLAAVYVTIAALFGLRLVRAHLAALLLLGFLVPSGQFLVPPLQVLSAKIAAGLLRVVGAPIFLDGVFIQMPEGSYHVEPGCAGLNFVLVTIVLALVVGELFYATIFKKVAVMVGLLAVAVVANPVRIFVIIFVDWLTNRTTDIVSDHLTYGWAFFAAILAVVMPFALRYRDDTGTPAPVAIGDAALGDPGATGVERRLAVTAIVGVVLVALAPAAILALGSAAAREGKALPALPNAIQDAALTAPAAWRATAGAIAQATAVYASGAQQPITADIGLRLAPSPRARLVDRWQPLAMNPPPRFFDTAQAGAGTVALHQSGGIGDRTLWVTCYLVGGTCYPDAGGRRRAVLASLARDPLARSGFIALSQPATPSATGSRPEHYRPLLGALNEIVAAIAPGVAAK